MTKEILVLGNSNSKFATTYNNVLEAVKQTGVEATVTKVQDIEGMMKYKVLTMPVLMIDEKVMVKGRIATLNEIKLFLS
jgi:hypothetical protein